MKIKKTDQEGDFISSETLKTLVDEFKPSKQTEFKQKELDQVIKDLDSGRADIYYNWLTETAHILYERPREKDIKDVTEKKYSEQDLKDQHGALVDIYQRLRRLEDKLEESSIIRQELSSISEEIYKYLL